MASYQQSQPTQFTPFIDTENTDLYGQVIMQRQALYDQGVQRTQQYIDNFTKLKVGREQDQQYLQSKVASLKAGVEGVGKADYSKNDVIRQVGSIASSIYNDRRIQKDVISAANYADVQRQIVEAQKKGVYKDSNAFLLEQRVKEWQEGGEDAALGKQNYIPADDYNPRFSKFMKDVNKHVIVDQSGKDDNGNPLMYVIRDNKREYLTQSEVENHWNTFLTADAKAAQQVDIDRNYFAKKVTPQQGFQLFLKSRENDLRQKTTDIKTLKEAKALYGGSNKMNSQYDDKIAILQKQAQQIQTDPEAYYNENQEQINSQAYLKNLASQQASRFVVNNTETKLIEDPILNMQMKVQEHELKVKKLQKELEPEISQTQLTPPETITKPENYSAQDYKKELLSDAEMTWQQRAELVADFFAKDRTITGDFLSYDEQGNPRIKDKNKLQDKFQEINKMYLEGGLADKPADKRDLVQAYFEGKDPSKGAMFQKITQRKFNEWEADEKKIMDETKAKIDKKQLSTVYLKDGDVQVTGQDMLAYTMGQPLPPEKKALIENDVKRKSPNNTIGDYLPMESALGGFKAGLKNTALPDLDSLAKQRKEAILYPTVKIDLIGDKDSDPINRSKLNDLVGVVAERIRTGGSDNDKEALNYLMGVAASKDDGTSSQKPVVKLRKDGNKYSFTIENNPKIQAIEVPAAIAQKLSYELTAPDEIGGYRMEMEANGKKGQAKTDLYHKDYITNGKGYSMNYEIVNQNGAFYNKFYYKKAGADQSKYNEITSASAKYNSLREANDAIQAFLKLNPLQFEDMIKNYEQTHD